MTNNKSNKKELPFVSVCTPTFNRRPFIENMFNCFRNQTYPKHRVEWIIVDDGTDKIRDLVEQSGIQQIRYFEVDKKMSLGAKRNHMHKFVRGSIIVYMDDDDYYPPERIEDAVDKLQANPEAMCAGSSEIYIYFKHIQKMYKCGPYGPNHATAGTFAFRTELLKQTRYKDEAALAEERAFLKDYTVPFVQLDPMKAILVFSHEHNTFDKRKMLDNQHPNFFRECDKTVDMFIRKPSEQVIKDFFMKEIDGLLEKYEPGLPKMKPDVLKQMKEIEIEREKMMKEEMEKMKQNGPIMLQRPGEEPIQLSTEDVVNIIQQQQQQLAQFSEKINEQENSIKLLQQQLLSKTKTLQQLSGSNGSPSINISDDLDIVSLNKKNTDLENMVVVLQKQLIEKTKTIRELSNNNKNTGSTTINLTSNSDDVDKKIGELQNVIELLQKQLIEKTKTIRELSNNNKNTGSTSVNISNNSVDVDKKIGELQNVIELLQGQLIEKARLLREAAKNNGPIKTEPKEKMTRIPIEIEETKPPTNRSKSDPEIFIEI
jgi:glycosyltransferase involved in cell wall biosynthesis